MLRVSRSVRGDAGALLICALSLAGCGSVGLHRGDVDGGTGGAAAVSGGSSGSGGSRGSGGISGSGGSMGVGGASGLGGAPVTGGGGQSPGAGGAGAGGLSGGVDAGVDASISCGAHVCGAGTYCCNASCGICAPRGAACIQIACLPDARISGDANGCVAVPALDDQCVRYGGTPHIYRCVLASLPPPCVGVAAGNVTDSFCCP